MARVTVEDCVEVLPNRFELVLLAARRARDISAGAQLTVSRDNDKNPVIALREIAEQSVSTDNLRDVIIRGLQRVGFRDRDDEELEESLDDNFALTMGSMDEDDDDDDDIAAINLAREEAADELEVFPDEEL